MIGYLLGVFPSILGQILLLLIGQVGAGLLPAVLETTTAPLETAAAATLM